VICVAKNTFSLLENGNAHHAAVTRPVQVFPDGVTEVALGVEHLAASGNTTCFSKGGLLQCWSENNSGEVGNGDESLGRVIQGRANVAF
jgi:hypothetical protein